MTPKKIVMYGLALIAAIFALTLMMTYGLSFFLPKDEYSHSHDEHEHSEEEENTVHLTPDQIKTMGLDYVIVGPGDLQFALSARGKIILHPDHLAHIIPKASGIAKEATKNIGNHVQTNDLMAVLESRDMADVKAEYLASLSKKRLTKTLLDHEKKLYEDKISAGQDYLNAKNVYEEALINEDLAKQKLYAFGLKDDEINNLEDQSAPDLRLYEIRSPLDGTVIMRHITKGEFVESTTTIYEVADLSTVWVEIGVYPKDLYKVKEGQIVEVIIPLENKKTKARLIYVSPIVAEDTINAKAIAEIDNQSGEWRPGIFVVVNIATEKKSLPFVIPKEAVQNSDGVDYVFVEVAEGFEKKEVVLGQSDDLQVEILSGLQGGEKIVASKTFLLKADLGKSSAEHEH